MSGQNAFLSLQSRHALLSQSCTLAGAEDFQLLDSLSNAALFIHVVINHAGIYHLVNVGLQSFSDSIHIIEVFLSECINLFSISLPIFSVLCEVWSIISDCIPNVACARNIFQLFSRLCILTRLIRSFSTAANRLRCYFSVRAVLFDIAESRLKNIKRAAAQLSVLFDELLNQFNNFCHVPIIIASMN